MSITLEAIRAEIQQAQQPLLEKIDELENYQASDELHIWKLECLVAVLIDAFPPAHAAVAAAKLQHFLDDVDNDQRKSNRGLELNAARLKLLQLQATDAKS